jgi:hypothetical protein
MLRQVCVAACAAGLGALGLTGCGVDWNSTDCFADFPSTRAASRVLVQAKAHGMSDVDLVRHPNRSASIRISSPDTGDDAAEFRSTVRRLVRRGGGHLEKNTPCIERPPFT